METLTIEKTEIYHRDFNLNKNHNVDKIKPCKALFGVFAIVNDEPINCRYISTTENLQQGIIELYENPPSEGIRKFMQGPWIQMLVFQQLDENVSIEETHKLLEAWIEKYNPKIDDEGEYPGYYDY